MKMIVVVELKRSNLKPGADLHELTVETFLEGTKQELKATDKISQARRGVLLELGQEMQELVERAALAATACG